MRVKSCRPCAIVGEGIKDEHALLVPPAGPYSVCRTAAVSAETEGAPEAHP